MSIQKNLPTFEEAWQIVMETSTQIKHTQEQIERTEEQMAKTEENIKTVFAELRQLFAEVAEERKKTEAQVAEERKKTERQFRETDKKIGELSSKWGRFVEGLVLPAAKRMFQARGIPIYQVSPRVKVERDGQQMEIDIMLVNREHVVLIEVKSTLGVEDVREHLEQLAKFKTFFPDYANRKVIGAVAGIVIEDGVDRFAYKQGLYVIGQNGETVEILNDDAFEPKTW
jgi:TPP-dependent indolepyruvate ferredoxin oxidoreductase alpha subunit